ncbi:hypothetical protein [Halalkalibacter alkaliphilus]|uniref:Uncharacterized protein n=1 Tax=Halalkalibacter alkaliphilus TaxID=2917993 RepID=A0A9X2A182_9BACI|nr:hypothetical protein [Halalkalibacter alkaliphilus]MCL7745985.1 hypothetical protein [Halalkalibacter alkaliphilus]
MIKQLLAILFAASMFVTVWVLVILQFNGTQKVENYKIESITYEDREGVLQAATIERENEEPKHNTRSEELNDTINMDENKNDETTIINLEDFDFSDVSTPEGVPIQEILTKLKLD